MSGILTKIQKILGEYFPSLLRRLQEGNDLYVAIAGGIQALEEGSLSWARLNQILHRSSEAGVSEGFFQYYFLDAPPQHPYPVDRVFSDETFRPPEGATEIKSLEQFHWGLRRFIYDAMLYWGNFRQAFRELRQREFDNICEVFAAKRIDERRMTRRGKVEHPEEIARDSRYLISEQACKTYEDAESVEQMEHVKFAVEAFRRLQSRGVSVTPDRLKDETRKVAKGDAQLGLFELMYEDTERTIDSEPEVAAIYSGQWDESRKARKAAMENTRVYLSTCNDLDVYVAGSMRYRTDFRYLARTCEEVFSSERLRKYNIRYFDPSLSAARYHEDKGLIECLIVKTAKVVLYLSQHKESLGKVSEYAMGVILGKPVIVLCPDDDDGREMYRFYRDRHPLMRLVQFENGVVNGAMVTHKVEDVVRLLERVFSNSMEYDLERKKGTDAYYLLKERLTGTTVRVITDDKLLTETFWNNWHGMH